MFLSDKLCFLQLHRTGTTHIAKLLKKYIPEGNQIGFHNRATKDIYNSNLFFLGSVRNPWDWYVSTWGKGCDGVGITYKRLTEKKFYFNNLGFKTKPWLSPYIFLQQINKPLNKWRELYSDPKNPENFRSWLKLYLQERIFDDPSGYGISDINKFSGHLSYRYLTLFLKNDRKLFDNSIKNYSDLKKLDEQDNVLNYVIKNENLVKDLLNCLDKFEIKINEQERKIMYSLEKTNKSNRDQDFLRYYDQDTLDLVGKKEKLIIEKYNYNTPKI
jgi:hypothetical protein